MEIKKSCDDFIVKELLDTTLLSKESTAYHLYLLTKKNYTTERAVQHIARALHLPRKFIGYAGAKDKRAITSQYITIKGVKKEKIAQLELKDIQLEFKGYAVQQFTLGNLLGNTFDITVYKPDFLPAKLPARISFPNYFDEQRFSKNNFSIGKAIFLKNFQKAVELIIEGDADYKTLLQDYLQSHEHDYVGALHRIPRKTLLFYVHAVQSKLFNIFLSKQILNGFSVSYQEGTFIFSQEFLRRTTTKTLPLIGYGTTLSSQQQTVLQSFDLETTSFIVRQLPELSLEGQERKMFLVATDCKIIPLENDAVRITFTLPKGAYATILLKALFAKR